MRPRILFVDHAGVLGGAELYLFDIVSSMKEQAHVVLFEDGAFLDKLKGASISAEVLKASGGVMNVERTGGKLQSLKAVPGIMRMVMRLQRLAKKYDLVYANSQKAFVIGAIAAKVAGRPLIWNLHDILTADHFSASHRKLGVFLANQFANHIIVNSKATLQAFEECGGDVSKSSIIYNGVDSSRFDQVDQSEVEDVRKSLGLEGCTVVGVFSRLTPWKGQHILLEALSHLPNVHAVLVGGALFQDDKTYERSLRNLADQMGITNRVHFLGFRDDVPRLMKAVDIVLHSSTSPEPFGRVIVEGMFAGRPVIATNAGGAREIVEDHKTGLLIPLNNPMAMTSAIKRLQSSPEEAKQIAKAGHDMAHSRFSVETIVDQVQEKIRQVVGDLDVHTYSETSTSAI